MLALVTGGSRGIGKSIVETLSSNGLSVISISRKSQASTDYKLSQNDNSFIPQPSSEPPSFKPSKSKIFQIECDLADISHENYEKLFSDITAVEKDLGKKVSILVNNAGITSNRLLLSTDVGVMQQVMNLNLMAPILLSKQLLRSMIRERNGCIINISSIVGGIQGNSGQTLYSASKAGLIGFTKSLAKEVGPKNIRVNAIAPGFIETDMTVDLVQKKELLNRIPSPLGFGSPRHVSHAVWYLVNNPYMNGSVVVLDGALSS